MEWNPVTNLNKLIANVDSSISRQQVLHTGDPHVVSQSTVLKIPSDLEVQIQVDFQKSIVDLSISGNPDPEESATSITSIPSYSIEFERLRSFVHDFTFGILTTKTDTPVSDYFPKLYDNHDNDTPDLIIKTNTIMVILEFATTKYPQNIETPWRGKTFKYSKALADRISKSNDEIKYYFSPIIVSSNVVIFGAELDVSQRIIDELCARYRFAQSIILRIQEEGVQIKEDTHSQLKESIFQSIKNMSLPNFPVPRMQTLNVNEENAEAYTYKLYEHCFTKAIDSFNTSSKIDGEDLIKQYEDSTHSGVDRMKKIIHLPTITLNQSNWNWELSDLEEDLQKDPYILFINDVIVNSIIYRDNWSGNVEEMIRVAELQEGDEEVNLKKHLRRYYHRINISLSPRQRLEFAKRGVQAKTMSNHPDILMYREFKKKPISIHTDISDITQLILNEWDYRLFEKATTEIKTSEIVNDLIKDSLQLHGGSNYINLMNKILAYKVSHWLEMITRIGMELCISMKQNVDKDEFIVKKLEPWDLYMIIKPTRLESHIFYMLIFPKDFELLMPYGIGSDIYSCSNYCYTQWASYDVSKLVNLCRCLPFFISGFAQWSRFYNTLPDEGIEFKCVRSMNLLSLLILLEDKPRTEEMFTKFRYIAMNKFTTLLYNPVKLLEKFPSYFRSRLQIWACKRLLAEMLGPKYKQQKILIDDKDIKLQSDEDLQRYKWSNLKNPYLNETLESVQQLVELFYLGYATNKDAKAWPNTDFQLVEKIVKYEKKHLIADKKYQGESTRPIGEDYQFGEWGTQSVARAADCVKSLLASQYGPAWLSVLEDDILHRLSRITWDSMATLKASSLFSSVNPDAGQNEDKKGKTTTHREKVLFRILEGMNVWNPQPMLSLEEALKKLEFEGGLCVDIFKKNQHAGLREIYVLTIEGRIIQLCIEEISRAICDKIPMEMMTHPKNKVRNTQQHMYKTAIKKSQYKCNISSSNDAAVWNQGHHVVKFFQFLSRILPKPWHTLLERILRLWLTKRIKLPDGVINHLRTNPTTPLYSEIHENIRLAYLGLETEPWLKPNTNYLTIQSGMMQGILHYTSSLFHCGLLLSRQYCWKKMSQKLCISNETLDLVSSDDSSRMTDLFAVSEKALKLGMIGALADHHAIVDYSKSFGVEMSVKSAIGVIGFMEFNSEFYMSAQVIRPTLKWWLASINVVEVESLVERQEVSYNLISDLLEGGSGFIQAHITQMCQAILHYYLIGALVNSLFPLYAIELQHTPDPSLGYFILDHPLTTGLSGFSYNLWNLVSSRREVSKIYSSLMVQGQNTSTSSGQLTRGLQIRYGERKKIQRLIETCETVAPDWRDQIEQNPEVLYSVSRSLSDAKLKIMTKLTSPLVIRSLAKSNSVSRMMASSVYLINTHAISVGSLWSDKLENTHKTSLWKIIKSNLMETPELTEDQYKILFPYLDNYKTLKETFSEFSTWTLAHFGSKKKLRNHIPVITEEPSLPFTLEDMVQWRWFGLELSARKKELEKLWNIYKLAYPWLEDDPIATLNNPNCHLQSQIQLRNFIARQKSKSRNLEILCPPLTHGQFRDSLVSVIIKNQAQGYTLVNPNMSFIEPSVMKGLISDIAGLIQYPLKEQRKLYYIENLLLKYPRINKGDAYRHTSSLNRLSIMQEYLLIKYKCDDRLSDFLFINKLKSSRLGVIGGFPVRQQLIDGRWRGRGKWLGVIGEATCSFELWDNELKKIYTNDIQGFRESEPLIRNLLKELGVTNYKQTFGDYDVYFDLSVCRKDPIGVGIVENKALSWLPQYSMDNIYITLTQNTIRLMIREYNTSYTLMSYTIHPGDFRVTSQSTARVPWYIDMWLKNKSISPESAHNLLRSVMKNLPLRDADQEAFIEFVKISLSATFIRKGWPLRQMKTLIQQNIVMDSYEDLLDYGNIDMGIDLLETIDSSAIDTEVNMASFETDWQYDILIGPIISQSVRSVGDIRLVHNYWDNFIQSYIDNTNSKERNKLSKKIHQPKLRDLEEILTFYMGIQYEHQNEESYDTAQTLDDWLDSSLN